MLLEMPVLDNALEAGSIAFGPLMMAARLLPWTVSAVSGVSRAVPRGAQPFWPGVMLDTLDEQPAALAATVHGIFPGRTAPPRSVRTTLDAPALVVGHPHDPIHPAADAAMLAEGCRAAGSWRPSRSSSGVGPDRLDAEAVAFVRRCWRGEGRQAAVRHGYPPGRPREGARSAMILSTSSGL